MQLRKLFFFFFVLMGWLNNSAAQDDVRSEVYLQTFNNSITVITPVISYNKEFSTETDAGIKLTFDFVGQKVDGVSGASRIAIAGQSKEGFIRKNEAEENEGIEQEKDDDDDEGNEESEEEFDFIDIRKEITLSLNHHLSNTLELKMVYDFSTEKDYLSHSPSITLVKDFFMKNTTIALGYSRNFDKIHGVYMNEALSKNINNYFFSYTQVLTPLTIAQVAYSRSLAKGFMPTGTKKVSVNGTDYDENMPDKREKNIYVARINQYIHPRASVQTSYRYYRDDWQLKSHTGEAEIFKYLGDNALLRLNYRYYEQTGAFFYQGVYSEIREFITAESQLGSMVTHLYGLKFIYSPDAEKLKKIHNVLSQYNSRLEFKYERYTQSVGIKGHIFQAALNLIF